ncbi:pre-mRNA-splicing factor syf1 [Coemansia sp. S610]|nr:pre-mRNA-splicing factor syf1 [Coemansia sp. S610]
MDSQVDITEDDLRFEEEVHREPYKIKGWQRYIDYKQESKSNGRPVTILFERALTRLPGSYSLWHQYLNHRLSQLRTLNAAHSIEEYRRVTLCFERALLHLHKMPRIWLMYTDHLSQMADVTMARRGFDRALRALPVTQHRLVWPRYLRFARRVGGIVTERVYSRYLLMWPEKSEELVDWCITQGRWAEAARRLVAEIDAGRGGSAWRRLAQIMRAQPGAVAGLRVEAILRDGIGRGMGELWPALAAHFVARGLMEQARDVYEEAVGKVGSVKDFAMVFDAYAAFEETGVTAALEAEAERVAAGGTANELMMDLRLLRLERLMDRRPFLANDVVLRQNPNSVAAWLKRVSLWQEKSADARIIATFEEALKRVVPDKACDGKLSELWLAYAAYFGESGRLDEYRSVMDRAVAAPLGSKEELADLYVSYAESEIARGSVETARRVLTLGTAHVAKYLRVWALLIDLEEAAGSVVATRAAYDRVVELRIATPQTIVDYAQFLEDHQFFEDSFRVFERGITAFGYPVAIDLWNVYLARFVKRYGGEKLERTRDLFEQALAGCPPAYAQSLYLAYGRLEEEYGLARRALRVYERAALGVAKGKKLEMYRYYVAKTAELLGLPATRPVYERGIEELGDVDAVELVLEYAGTECRLGEIDRARALYQYAAQLGGERLWPVWHEFEVQHGNEDTFKEMLRIKRSAATKFGSDAKALAKVEVEKQAQRVAVSSSVVDDSAALEPANPDALDIDDDDF